MSLSELPVETSGNDLASERARAIDAFLAQARSLLAAGPGEGHARLQPVADALIALGRRADLFPAAHFPIDAERPAQVYRLAEDADGGFALYLSAGLAGKAQPPHDHTTWAIIAGSKATSATFSIAARRPPIPRATTSCRRAWSTWPRAARWC